MPKKRVPTKVVKPKITANSRKIPQISDKTASLIFLCIFVNVIAGYWLFQYYQPRILSFAGSPVDYQAINPQLSREYIPAPVTVEIPAAHIRAAVTTGQIQRGIWKTSSDSVLHLDISARPSQPGNIILYGHNWQNLLGNLPQTEIGQIIKIFTTDGNVHQYRIIEKKTVQPNDLSVIAPTSEEVLTMYTCTGLFDSLRLVVRAIPITSSGF